MNRTGKRDPLGLIGEKLNRYKIEEFAGEGGVSVVYRAQHEIGHYTVAVKVLKREFASDPRMIKMFLAEGRNTARLNHPSIVQIKDVDQTEDDYAYLVMEWLDGQTLDEDLKRSGPLTVERVADLLDQICTGIEFAHNKGIIHRDLKPGNIMLIRDNQGDETIRILDFGIAKVLDATVGTNTQVAGTYYYTSPEQLIKGATIDRRTDVYSLGVMVYQMLTGERPFESDSLPGIIELHREAPPRPLREINPSIPQAVEAVVLRALAKDPANRHRSAIEFARAFRHVAGIRPGSLIVECTDSTSKSRIPDATIYLNGKHIGQTDAQGELRLEKLAPKAYRVEAGRSRYLAGQREFTLEPDLELTISLVLKREPKGALEIRCDVQGARIELDGRKIGIVDESQRIYLESVDAGRHRVRATHKNYLPYEQEVEVEVWGQASCVMAMKARAASVWLKSLLSTFNAEKKGLMRLGPQVRSLLKIPSLGKPIKPGLKVNNLLKPLIFAPVLAALALGGYGYYRWKHSHPPQPIANDNLTPGPSATPAEDLTVVQSPAPPQQQEPANPPPGPTDEPLPTPPATAVEALNNGLAALNARNCRDASVNFDYARSMGRGNNTITLRLAGINQRLGDLCKGRGNYREAEKAYLFALRSSPNDIDLNDKLGDVYNAMRKYRQAADQFNRVIGLGRRDAQSYYKSGKASLAGGNFMDATRACIASARIDSQLKKEAFNCTATAFDALGKYNEAIQNYKNARDTFANDNDDSERFKIGLAAIKKRDFGEADRQVRELRRTNSGFASALDREIAKARGSGGR